MFGYEETIPALVFVARAFLLSAQILSAQRLFVPLYSGSLYANASDRLIYLLGGQKSNRGVEDSALKRGWITPVTCQFDVLLSPILVLVLCSMFFDPFEPLINVLILPANSLALFLVQKLRERH